MFAPPPPNFEVVPAPLECEAASSEEVSFLNPHTHKPWVAPTHVGRCGLQKLVADSRG